MDTTVTNGNLTTASRQWASRPDDERFTSLPDLHAYLTNRREHSRAIVLANRDITISPADESHKGIAVTGPAGIPFFPSHHAFGQLAGLAGAPAGYLRSLPAELVADCMNYGLHVRRDVEEAGLLLYKNGGAPMVNAATGPDYGRIWDNEIVGSIQDSGLSNRFAIPGEFGKQVAITKANTTLYAGDRDMFIFLADETNRVQADRRGGAGLARGFLMWNSEVGSSSYGCAMFLFDYACANRIIWGVGEFREIRIRHTKGGPARFAEQIAPILYEMANSSPQGIEETIRAAQLRRVTGAVDKFLAERFGKHAVKEIVAAHTREESRPVETIWDAVTAATAYAKTIRHQNDRVDVERQAGKLLDLVAA